MSTVTVLSIDAWANGDDWTWNCWYKVGECNLDTFPSDEKEQIAWFVSEGYANEKALTECYIDDDQHNFVLTVKETNEPLFAVAYGEAQ